MANLSLTTAANVLQDDYQQEVRDFLNQNTFVLSQTDVNTSRVSGRRAYHAAHTQRSSGVGSRADGGSTPTAASQGYENLLIPIRYTYGRIELTGPTIKAMGKDSAAFVDAVDSEMTGIKDDMQRERSRQAWGTSDGVIIQCGVTSASTTLVLAPTATEVQFEQMFSDGGMVVDIGTVAAPTAAVTAAVVVSVDFDAKTAVLDTAVTTTALHFLFRTGAGGASSGSGLPGDGQSEITGLQSIIDDDSNLHGLAFATNPKWQAQIDENSGVSRPVSEQLINKMIHKGERSSGRAVNLLVGSDGVSRSAAARLEAQRRNIDNVDLKAGYSGIAWSTPAEGMGKRSQTALVWDRDAPNNKLFGICTDGLVRYQMQDYEWMDMGDGVFSKVVGKDAYEATLTIYDELAATQRNCHIRIDDLTEAG